MNSTGTRKSLILALACLAQFMVVLDIAIVNVALPAFSRSSIFARAPCNG